jgi:hypothetical protein
MLCFSKLHSAVDGAGNEPWKRHKTKRIIVKMMPLRTKRGRANIVVALYGMNGVATDFATPLRRRSGRQDNTGFFQAEEEGITKKEK